MFKKTKVRSILELLKKKPECKGGVKFNSHLVFIYYNRTEIARHQILPRYMANAIRKDEAHLPFPLRKNLSVDTLRDKARETGPKTFEVIRRMFVMIPGR